MRCAPALAALAAATAVAGAASAETWSKYVDAAGGTQWSYDADMQAISKPDAKLGPSGPGKPDGVGSVVAIDCAKKNLITVAAYSPSKALDIPGNWRSETPKRATGAENEALLSKVCPHADHVPVK